jgi:hypothetical protein
MASLSSLNFRLTANIAPFRNGLNKAERAMDKMGRKMQQTGKNLSMKLTAPIAALGAMSFNVFRDFELEMAKVKAVSGATSDEFKALSDNAKELGRSTIFSAREVAGLQLEFAKLGFTAKQITGVTEATLNLAQASGTDLARAAEVAGSTLRGLWIRRKRNIMRFRCDGEIVRNDFGVDMEIVCGINEVRRTRSGKRWDVVFKKPRQ